MKRYLTAAFLLAVGADAVFADVGIDFAHMPVGCHWTREFSNENKWIETFTGPVGDSFTIRATDANASNGFVNVTTYDHDGHRTKLTWANGSWSTFFPRSCYAVAGKCHYIYKNSDGVEQEIDSQVKLKGSILITNSKAVGQDEFPREKSKIGPYNILSNSAKSYSTKVSHFEKCDLPTQ